MSERAVNASRDAVTATRKLLLNGIKVNARALEDTGRTLNNLICRAAENGVPQTAIAKAAGTSQAHISRTIAANRKLNDDRKATRASNRRAGDGRV